MELCSLGGLMAKIMFHRIWRCYWWCILDRTHPLSCLLDLEKSCVTVYCEQIEDSLVLLSLAELFAICSILIPFFIKIQRLPCLPSSMVALDTLMGTDESIGFEDFLNGMTETGNKLISTTKLCSFLWHSHIPLSDVF